jgi:hypothetical protein
LPLKAKLQMYPMVGIFKLSLGMHMSRRPANLLPCVYLRLQQ